MKSTHERELWAQFDALQLGSGFTAEDIQKPQILIEDVFGDSHPGSVHLNRLTEQVKYGVYQSGGVPYVQLLLKEHLHLDVMTVTGKTLDENLEELQKNVFFERYLGYLANYHLERDDVIFPVEKAEEIGSIAILKGNIAPEGSVIKYSACVKDMLHHKGVARVFDSEEDAHRVVVNGKINPHEVIVIRYEGPRGSGMPELLMTTEAIVCDERLNGTVAFIEDGDIIEYDVEKRTLNVVGIHGKEMPLEQVNAVLLERSKRGIIPRPPRRGLYKRYTESAASAMEGASY